MKHTIVRRQASDEQSGNAGGLEMIMQRRALESGIGFACGVGTFGDDELNGLYFQKPMKQVATSIAGYMMRSSHIDDVFESDDALERQIVETIKRFDPANLH